MIHSTSGSHSVRTPRRVGGLGVTLPHPVPSNPGAQNPLLYTVFASLIPVDGGRSCATIGRVSAAHLAVILGLSISGAPKATSDVCLP